MVALRCKALVSGQSVFDFVGSSPAKEMGYLFRQLCVVRKRFLRRADKSLRETYKLRSVVLCDSQASRMSRPCPVMGVRGTGKKGT